MSVDIWICDRISFIGVDFCTLVIRNINLVAECVCCLSIGGSFVFLLSIFMFG